MFREYRKQANCDIAVGSAFVTGYASIKTFSLSYGVENLFPHVWFYAAELVIFWDGTKEAEQILKTEEAINAMLVRRRVKEPKFPNYVNGQELERMIHHCNPSMNSVALEKIKHK